MMIKTKKTWLMALVLVLVIAFVTSVIASSQVESSPNIQMTVEEAISITPESLSVTLYPGEVGSADFTITNIARVSIPLKVFYNVTAWPEGGDPNDITIWWDWDNTIVDVPELSQVTITIPYSVATGAVPGNYTIALLFTRV